LSTHGRFGLRIGALRDHYLQRGDRQSEEESNLAAQTVSHVFLD
jgi:hypothetical protein